MTDVLKKSHFAQQTVILRCDWSNVKRQHPQPFTFSLLARFNLSTIVPSCVITNQLGFGDAFFLTERVRRLCEIDVSKMTLA